MIHENRIPLLRINYDENELNYLSNEFIRILKSGHLTMHNNVSQFENDFSIWNGSKFALGTNSGTSSLEIPLRAIGVKNKVVVCPSNTYMATPIAAIHAGAKVCFTDTDPNNMQMSVESLRVILKSVPNIGCVIIVHIGGIISENIFQIISLCNEYKIPLIEDAAHAHGASFRNIRAGNFGVAGSFSFYPTKVMNTAEGGMMVTSNQELYEIGLSLREHGKIESGKNVHGELGYNWRFSEINALLGINEVKNASRKYAQRVRIASIYDEQLSDIKGIKKIKIDSELKPAFYKYIIILDEKFSRERIKMELKDLYGIECPGEVYSQPCHSQPVFIKYPETIIHNKDIDYKNTIKVCNTHMCLPLYPGLSDKEILYVCESFKKVIAFH